MRQAIAILWPSFIAGGIGTVLFFNLLDPRGTPMRLASLLLLALPAFAAQAQDAARGRELYQTYCGGCHYERVHDRLRTEVKDLSDLRDMVARWAPQTKRSLSLDEREDMVQYLNQSHYRFGLPPRRKP